MLSVSFADIDQPTLASGTRNAGSPDLQQTACSHPCSPRSRRNLPRQHLRLRGHRHCVQDELTLISLKTAFCVDNSRVKGRTFHRVESFQDVSGLLAHTLDGPNSAGNQFILDLSEVAVDVGIRGQSAGGHPALARIATHFVKLPSGLKTGHQACESVAR